VLEAETGGTAVHQATSWRRYLFCEQRKRITTRESGERRGWRNDHTNSPKSNADYFFSALPFFLIEHTFYLSAIAIL
jgi:hypothetical protein